MYCTFCGKPIAAETRFCPFCGKQLRNEEKNSKNKPTTSHSRPKITYKKRRTGLPIAFGIVLAIALVILGILYFSNRGGGRDTDELIQKYFDSIDERKISDLCSLVLPETRKHYKEMGYSEDQLLSSIEFFADGDISFCVDSWKEVAREKTTTLQDIQRSYRQRFGAEIEDFITVTARATTEDKIVLEFDISCVLEDDRWYLSGISANYYSLGYSTYEELVSEYFSAAKDSSINKVSAMFAPGYFAMQRAVYNSNNAAILLDVDSIYCDGYYGLKSPSYSIIDYQSSISSDDLSAIQREYCLDVIPETATELTIDTGEWGDGLYYIDVVQMEGLWYLVDVY